MQNLSLPDMRRNMRIFHRAPETDVLDHITSRYAPDEKMRARIAERAERVVKQVRSAAAPTLMESFLTEYGLSNEEGVALMTLAEALLRVPDSETIDQLIEDKIVASKWHEHFNQSENVLVNASSFALSLTKGVLDKSEHSGPVSALRAVSRRLGAPIIRRAVQQAMRELGNQFVLGETIDEALKRAEKWKAKGATYSYDMLGEAAITAADADNYFASYMKAIEAISRAANSADMRENPGLSIKLSALHPRYEMSQQARAIPALAQRLTQLAYAAKEASIGLNIDAEEAHRLGMSLDMIELVLGDPQLAGWDGFGVVVQAYSKRATHVIDWLHALAEKLDRRIMVRLVKGAYWDTEIKRAQVAGVADFPVFTAKSASDVSYICCAKQLLGLTDRIYPQFATHNAHSVAAILEMADGFTDYEFQRLHGMGENLHGLLLQKEKVRSRVYAPVGRHRELLAYLVRRLLENSANSSFVHQLANHEVPASAIAADPFGSLEEDLAAAARKITKPPAIYAPARQNSQGWDLANRRDRNQYIAARVPFAEKIWRAHPIVADNTFSGVNIEITSPSENGRLVGMTVEADSKTVSHAISSARPWSDATVQERAHILRSAADLFEANHGEIFALLAREAGKNPVDCIAELREAVDFLRYYAAEAEAGNLNQPRGIIACISPWNFPFAIFTGQVAAALVTGNAVLAKPAETTPLIATLATNLLHEAGVPRAALQLLPGQGALVGAMLSSDPRIDGVCFTGSTTTAQTINRAMATNLAPDAMLIAETGGLNCMIVDSSTLPEMSVRDIITSAFQSAGQRCSALRMLYLHEAIAEPFLEMLQGAMDELALDQSWEIATDIGPVIDTKSQNKIQAHINEAAQNGRLIKQMVAPDSGTFVGPAIIRVTGINDLAEEIFGPVLHVALYGKKDSLSDIIADINARGFGLTFGLATRITRRQNEICNAIKAGNIYVNRNQVGAVVESQPFGGEGLSGTGPKAGGPRYLPRFCKAEKLAHEHVTGARANLEQVQAGLKALPLVEETALASRIMAGVTGETNITSLYPRGRILCLGPSAEDAQKQASIAHAHGCSALRIAPGSEGNHALDRMLPPELLTEIGAIEGVAYWGEENQSRAIRSALAAREGALIPLLQEADFSAHCITERHICIDTTAAGGNISLLA